jgi:hypothetical protein
VSPPGDAQLGDLRQAVVPSAADDAYAEAVLDARLGRPARDVLEATVVHGPRCPRLVSSCVSMVRRYVR